MKTTIFVAVFLLGTKTSHNVAKYFIHIFIREFKIESKSSSGTFGKMELQFFQPQSLLDPQQLDQIVKVVTPNKNSKAVYQQGLPQMI